jgi:Mn-dependent DtxR family transcriptional regulator
MLGQVLKTFLVHRVPAIQEHTLVSALEHVFEANRTVALCHFVDVPVTVCHFY